MYNWVHKKKDYPGSGEGSRNAKLEGTISVRKLENVNEQTIRTHKRFQQMSHVHLRYIADGRIHI